MGGDRLDSIAHIRQSDGKIQTVEEHLTGVKELAFRFGSEIGLGHLAGLAGWLHDMGKFSETFRRYILDAVNNPDNPPKKGTVDHSTAGGKLLFEEGYFKNSVQGKMVAEIIGNAIISHHMGLQDFLTPDLDSDYLKRVKEKKIDDFDEITERYFRSICSKEDFHSYIKICESELVNFLKEKLSNKSISHLQFLLMLLTKYIFSCLIDADRTNTRCFEENVTSPIEKKNQLLFQQYYQKLGQHLSQLNAGNQSDTPINQLRAKMSDQCDSFADEPSGIYTLSIPTGGGKTLASLRYALKHAIKFNKDRIIYIVPYTTIIEQNAEEVKRILNDRENILEHHSNIIENEDDENNEHYVQDKVLKLAKDNWDAPIIYTTMVQFLNAFYSGGTRNVRRLHNLGRSVIIFDEVQSVPTKCISLFNQALNFLKSVGQSSLLLCTATQPALDYVKNKLEAIDGEIIAELGDVYQAFKRVEIVDKTKPDGWSTEETADFVEDCFEHSSSILVILNTKTVVRKLFNHMRERHSETQLYHLSTSMCAAHRKEILDKVRHAINNNERVICFSTQLIEAGVDISFECVIRSLAGLDSIAQAAGRCNRHGEHGLRQVYIINHNEEKLDYLKEIKVGASITQRMLKDRQITNGIKEILSPDALRLFFSNYYHELENELNYYIPTLKKEMFDLLNANQKYKDAFLGKTGNPFPLVLGTSIKTAGKHFNVIENNTTSVLVPFGGGEELIAELNGDLTIGDMNRLLREAQQYTVNIYQHELNELSKHAHIAYLRDGKILALGENAYDLDYGVNLAGDGRMETHFL